MRQLTSWAAAGVLAVSLAALAASALAEVPTYDVRPTGKGGSTVGNTGGDALRAASIRYHNGPVMTGGITAYYIWYGNWSGNTATTILTDMIQNEGGTPYWAINTNYHNGSNVKVSSVITYGGSYNDSYSQGSNLSDTGVFNVVSSAINGGHLPKSTSAVYFVLTSQDVNETSGFCTQYCGWHTYGTIGGSTIKYSFVGNAARCITSCAWQSTSPNGNAGADGMASILAHELEEAATDPQLNAWYFNTGNENADQCAWTFGTTYTVGNGSIANVHWGTRDYLIQRNWSIPPGLSQKCTMSYP